MGAEDDSDVEVVSVTLVKRPRLQKAVKVEIGAVKVEAVKQEPGQVVQPVVKKQRKVKEEFLGLGNGPGAPIYVDSFVWKPWKVFSDWVFDAAKLQGKSTEVLTLSLS